MKQFVESILPKYNITSAKVFIEYNLVLIKEINKSEIKLCFDTYQPESIKSKEKTSSLFDSSMSFLIEHNIKISDLINLEAEVLEHYKTLPNLVREG